jgi:ketosteroid isomerase-like protein
MKNCPACGSQYSDDSLVYCLQDGTPLDGGVKQSSVDTGAFTNPATVEKLYKTEDIPAAPAKTRNYQPFPQPPPRTQEKRSARPIVLSIGAIAALVLAAAGAGWFYLQGTNEGGGSKEFASVEPTNLNTSLPVAETLAEDTNSDNLPAGNESAKAEISEVLNAWAGSAKTKDLAVYLSVYAEKVDYFDTAGAPFADVRREVKKVFDAYEEIEIELSNIKIAADPNGNTATALFDKDWSYENGSSVEDGKARTRLHFEKIGGRWKIVSEKYLKVYYIDN